MASDSAPAQVIAVPRRLEGNLDTHGGALTNTTAKARFSGVPGTRIGPPARSTTSHWGERAEEDRRKGRGATAQEAGDGGSDGEGAAMRYIEHVSCPPISLWVACMAALAARSRILTTTPHGRQDGVGTERRAQPVAAARVPDVGETSEDRIWRFDQVLWLPYDSAGRVDRDGWTTHRIAPAAHVRTRPAAVNGQDERDHRPVAIVAVIASGLSNRVPRSLRGAESGGNAIRPVAPLLASEVSTAPGSPRPGPRGIRPRHHRKDR